MRRILGFVLLSILFSANLMAAQNSQTFYLAASTRAGNIQLPRGIYEITWSAPSKSRVTLTIRTENQKTFKIPSRVIEGKQDRIGVITSVVDGISYLQELDTSNARFILQNEIEGSK
ncbi:hypothetical protein HNQ77_001080 [Silvibacterium bohemicum]|uniref:Uncharacterized protein n=1 Tax=Silvibacterium bohemicum TaxID=1577686 RepID=A0A841JP62_9BACT|nr:hypothetical protein [Silvibacterium bohemicum]MBB6143136.1 hypothetical protein [Silvibacterium bohemicum]